MEWPPKPSKKRGVTPIVSPRAFLQHNLSLCQNESERESIQDIIDNLTAARLLVADRQGDEETIEIIHDALLRHWGQLKQWIADNRPFLAWHQSFEERVLEWKQRKRPKHLLYSSVQLKEAQRWTERKRLSEQEVAFLRASTTQRNLSLMGFILAVLLLISSAGVAVRFALTRPADPTLVTTPRDSVSGSLRYCIDNAPPGSTISFAPSMIQPGGTIIKLTGGGLAIAGGKQLTIRGPGANQLTISGGNLDAIIHVSKGAILNISGLSFKNSETISDAFLFNEGTLTLTNSIISHNKTSVGGAIFINSVSNGGNSLGGGIENRGTLTVANSTISNNSSSSDPGDSLGGGIENLGHLRVINSTISNNSVSSNDGGGSYGGGIDNYGLLLVTDSTFSNNSTHSNGSDHGSAGGGIYNHSHGTLTVTSSTFSNNLVSCSGCGSNTWSGGGGITNDGKLTVTSSTFSANSASNKQDGQGGGIDNDGTLVVTSSTFANNSASSAQNGNSYGGGINNYRTGTLVVTASTFLANSASSTQNGQSYGGGISNDTAGTVTVTASTFLANSASSTQNGQSYGGGIDNPGKLSVTSSTFANNLASSNGSGSNSFGGGIYNHTTGTVTVSTSTFSGNKISNSSGYSEGGGIENQGKLTVSASTFFNNFASSSGGNGFGGGIYNYAGGNQMTISSSIFAANTASDGPDISGALTSGGYNLLTNITGVTGLNARTDRHVTLVSLKLDPVLRNNGGPTQTLKLLPGSAAIDAIPGNACTITFTDASGHTEMITTDQRGNPRPDGSENACDIGAYESSY